MIPYNFKEYYRNVSQLKDRGHVGSGEQIRSPVSAGSRGLQKLEKFTRAPVQMMAANPKDTINKMFSELKRKHQCVPTLWHAYVAREVSRWTA